MYQRLLNTTKWLWYLLAFHAATIWTPARSVTVRAPPSDPTATIESQAKFFQDFFSVQLSPYKIEFGHVCEDPNTWEQRYEKKDFKNHRDMGKVRWGDKKGGYGEHYWDLNHAGHAGDQGNEGNDGNDKGKDDGSYRENNHESYDDPLEYSPVYGKEEYDSEIASAYDDNGRAKRAHPRVKIERKQIISEKKENNPRKQSVREILQAAPSHEVEYSNNGESYKITRRYQQQIKEPQEKYKPKEQRKQVVLVVTKKEDSEDSNEPVDKSQPDYAQYVPYEGGAGVRQHQRPDITASATVPRLFLEPSTGHVVDRATGQAYLLQPILLNNN